MTKITNWKNTGTLEWTHKKTGEKIEARKVSDGLYQLWHSSGSEADRGMLRRYNRVGNLQYSMEEAQDSLLNLIEENPRGLSLKRKKSEKVS